MHGPIKVKSPNNTSKWQMGFNSAFKGLKYYFLRNFKIFSTVYLEEIYDIMYFGDQINFWLSIRTHYRAAVDKVCPLILSNTEQLLPI
jgi:hypothetical protein